MTVQYTPYWKSLHSVMKGKECQNVDDAPSEFLYMIIMQPPRPVLGFFGRLVHFIMQRKQLVGIKQRAERQTVLGLSSAEEGMRDLSEEDVPGRNEA